MKFKNILLIIVLAGGLLTSCRDQIMEWEKDPSHGEIAASELPLELAEKITRYEPLRNYTDFKVGAGIIPAEYIKNETYRNIVDANFDEITMANEMKHAFVVKSNGELDFSQADAMISNLAGKGISFYGHTLCWHSNQNAGYLNGLIAPTIIPGAGGSNSLDLSKLKDGTFTGWARNTGAGIAVVENKGLTATSQAVELISSSTSANAWDLQLTTPDITIVNGHNYEISFYVKSLQPGKGRLSFSGLNNNYPWIDWYNSGSASESFSTTSQWQQVKFTTNDFVTAGTSFKISFDMGYLPDVTYYIDVNTIQVVDLDVPSTVVNMLANGKFDTDMTGWSMYNNGNGASTLTRATGAQAYEGGGSMKVFNDANNPSDQWKTQIHSDFTANLTAGETYTISYMIRSDAVGSVRCSSSGTAHYQGDQATSTTWSPVQWQITADGGETGLNFDLGAVQGTYYIDNVVVTNGDTGGGSGPTIIEKTDAEKKTIIEASLQDFISKMVTHFKDNVHAWDVVNEPMLENGTLRTGNVSDATSDQFYWVKYIGQDFAVQAFKLARQYGNPDDKLFINDYNLEYSLDKCDGLINYVNHIESQGATVDGIGTQMHISSTTDKNKIVQMFQKLAATGKLIKISELDIRLGTVNPTNEQLALQAEMYQYVIDMYMQYVPQAQRYGITVWGISDNADEHEYWLPDESPNLWNANYERKHAYKGFADGLAGKDISADFTGELQK
jgi:GH35 family endo-1,4-beta-xylanase